MKLHPRPLCQQLLKPLNIEVEEGRFIKDWRARDYGNEGEEGAHITDAAALAPPQGAFVLPLLSQQHVRGV